MNDHHQKDTSKNSSSPNQIASKNHECTPIRVRSWCFFRLSGSNRIGWGEGRLRQLGSKPTAARCSVRAQDLTVQSSPSMSIRLMVALRRSIRIRSSIPFPTARR